MKEFLDVRTHCQESADAESSTSSVSVKMPRRAFPPAEDIGECAPQGVQLHFLDVLSFSWPLRMLLLLTVSANAVTSAQHIQNTSSLLAAAAMAHGWGGVSLVWPALLAACQPWRLLLA